MGRKRKTINVEEVINLSNMDDVCDDQPDTEEYFLNVGQKRKTSGIHSLLVRQLSKLEPPDIDDLELVKRAKSGDQSGSFLLLVKHYKYILAKVIEATNGTWFSEDIFQAGVVGLYEAVKHYDMKRSNKFLTYAHYWILKFIYIEIRNELLPLAGIGVGRDTKERLYNYIKYKMQGMTDEQIKDKLHIKDHQLEEIKVLNSVASRVKSMDEPQESQSGSKREVTFSADGVLTSAVTVEDFVTTRIFIEFLEERVQELADTNPELALFMCYEFGFSGFDQLDKSEVCGRLHINYKQYDKLHKEGAAYLRDEMAARNWCPTEEKKEDKTVWEEEEDLPPLVKKMIEGKSDEQSLEEQ